MAANQQSYSEVKYDSKKHLNQMVLALSRVANKQTSFDYIFNWILNYNIKDD